MKTRLLALQRMRFDRACQVFGEVKSEVESLTSESETLRLRLYLNEIDRQSSTMTELHERWRQAEMKRVNMELALRRADEEVERGICAKEFGKLQTLKSVLDKQK